jgi:hypothetical protein
LCFAVGCSSGAHRPARYETSQVIEAFAAQGIPVVLLPLPVPSRTQEVFVPESDPLSDTFQVSVFRDPGDAERYRDAFESGTYSSIVSDPSLRVRKAITNDNVLLVVFRDASRTAEDAAVSALESLGK